MNSLITLHGINSSGPWQERVHPVLNAHFHHVPIKYRSYRWLGGTKLVLHPWPLLVCGAVLFFLNRNFHITPVRLVCSGVLIVMASHLISRMLRAHTVAVIKKRIDKVREACPRPHVIAHSFGTYLAGTALHRSSDLNFDSIILAGSVLSKKYNWDTIIAAQKRSWRVRNEVACRDKVARSASWLTGIVPGMGHSGFAGFTCGHRIDDPYTECSVCKSSFAAVHNVFSKELGHSDLLFDAGYARQFWLPFLWGIDAGWYRDFIDRCKDLADKQDIRPMGQPKEGQKASSGDIRKIYELFLAAPGFASTDTPIWRDPTQTSPPITPVKTMRQWMRDEISERKSKGVALNLSEDQVMGQAVSNICQQIVDALAQAHEVQANPALIRSLFPITAAIKAIDAVYADFEAAQSVATTASG